jgi:hypothetical protein
MCPEDTSPEAWQVFLIAQQRLTPGERIVRVLQHSEFRRSLVLAGLRRRHPEAGESEIFRMYARQKLGDELFRKVYGESA